MWPSWILVPSAQPVVEELCRVEPSVMSCQNSNGISLFDTRYLLVIVWRSRFGLIVRHPQDCFYTS